MNSISRLSPLLLPAAIAAALLTLDISVAGAGDAIAPTNRIDLFNGKDLTGWKPFLPGDADPAKTWSVRDGVIHCVGKPNGYLRTEQEYRDYKLTVEWRFLKPGNTGVLLHVSGPDQVWPICIEAQGQHGNQGDFWVMGGADFKEHRGLPTGRTARREPSNENPVGEWNTYEIICRGDTIRLFVNGKLLNEATECNATEGKICLQSEGGEFEVRKVTLEPAS